MAATSEGQGQGHAAARRRLGAVTAASPARPRTADNPGTSWILAFRAEKTLLLFSAGAWTPLSTVNIISSSARSHR